MLQACSEASRTCGTLLSFRVRCADRHSGLMAHQQPAGEAGTPSSPAGFSARWGAIQAALQRINVLQEWTAVAGGVPGKLVDSRGVARLCKRLRELADVLAQIASIDKAGSGTAAAGVFDAEDQAAYCAAAGFNFARAELLAQARETVSQPEGALDTALRFDIVSSCLKSIKHAMSRHSLVDAALLPLIVLATRSQEARASIAAEDAGDMLRKVLKVHAGNHHIVFSAVKLARLLVTSSLSRQAQLLDAKVLPQVVRVLEKHLDVSNIQAEGMRFMGNFAADAGAFAVQRMLTQCVTLLVRPSPPADDMRDAALQVGGVKAVLAAMEAHTADAQVMEWACGALANISSGNRELPGRSAPACACSAPVSRTTGTAQEQVASLPIIAALCEASRYYKAHPGILEAACAALANLTLLMRAWGCVQGSVYARCLLHLGPPSPAQRRTKSKLVATEQGCRWFGCCMKTLTGTVLCTQHAWRWQIACAMTCTAATRWRPTCCPPSCT